MEPHELFDIVERYAALGDHRTGTSVDRATLDWITDELKGLGLQTQRLEFEFPQWTGTSRLTAAGSDVDHLPVFYEFTGAVEAQNPAIVEIDPLFGGFPGVLDEPIASARAAGHDALVVATRHPAGSLVAINRVPDAGNGFPTLLIAGRDHARLLGVDLELELDAQLVTGASATIVANGGAERPIILTTPLTGWFSCAGERGTGIAVLLDVVSRCAHLPLMVLATTGHELDYLGARRWAEQIGVEPAAIVHLGASIAVDEELEDGTRKLVTTRQAMTNLDESLVARIAGALSDAGLALTPSAPNWIGEGAIFSSLGVPLLSISGAGPDFHTPEDRPRRVTSTESLGTVSDAVVAAIERFAQIARPDRNPK